MHFESTLSKITQEIYNAKTAQEAKAAMVTYLQSTRVKDRDRMIETVQAMSSLIKIQTYFSNCLLKFEGMGTSFNNSKSKEEKEQVEE